MSPSLTQRLCSADEENPLTARFTNVPAEHDGETEFPVDLKFSEPPAGPGWYGARNIAVKNAIDITGGTVVSARSVEQNGAHRRIVVQPSGTGPVTVALPAGGPECGSKGALCTEAGGRLEVSALTQIRGPAALSVADATVQEGPEAVLEFAVTLSRAASGPVTVDYATRDGTAHAGADYTAATGTLSFAPGETRKTVHVTVLDDSHDEGDETMTVRLSNASGAYIIDNKGTGTIENSDHMPAAWLSRFGRTVAEQVVDAAKSRLTTTPAPGANLTIAGLALTPGGNLDRLELDESTFGERTITGRDLLIGSSFSLATKTAEGGTGGLWGRGALSRFSGTEEDLSLNGDVASVLLGADWAHERWTTGVLFSHTWATGTYQGPDAGRVESELTGLYPYGRHAVSERISLWGVAGYGVGTLTLTPDARPALETGIDLAMAAVGARSVLLDRSPHGGPELAAVSDLMGVQTRSDAVRDIDAGNLEAARTRVTRLRLGLEGTWPGIRLGSGAVTPSVELGLRRDGGDAETGLGIDAGAGVAWSIPSTGLAGAVHARALLTHEAAGFRDQGLSASLGWDPNPTSDRGPSLQLTHSSGAAATGGMNALLSRNTLDTLTQAEERDSLELRLGYGVPALNGLFTATPELGLGISNQGREYRIGWRLATATPGPASLELHLEATRTKTAPAISLGLVARW